MQAFADGELPPRRRTAFGAHVAGCKRCRQALERIFQLKALAETVPLSSARPITQQIEVAVRRPWARALFPLLAVVLLAGAAVIWQLRSRRDAPWALASTRSVEARVSDPRGDFHRPYDPMRGAGAPVAAPDFRMLARLQERNEVRGIVSWWLLEKDPARAGAALEAAASDPSLDNERAVVALLQGRPAEALRFVSGVLGRDQRSAQASWNQGLALRDLGLALSAAEAFARVQRLGEPGWAAEAAALANELRARSLERRKRHAEVRAHLKRLSAELVPPPAALVERWPELVREALYEALRAAPDAATARRLAPLAEALDRRRRDRALTSFVGRVAGHDFARRGPLARRYRDLAARTWQESAPGELAALAADLRKAGASAADQLLGVLFIQAGLATSPGEPRALVAGAADAWLQIAAAGVEAALSTDTAPGGGQERQLRQAIDRAANERFVALQLRLQHQLITLLLNQARSIEAMPLARSSHGLAQAVGLWPDEIDALDRLLEISNHQEDTVRLTAEAHEISLVDGPCGDAGTRALARLTERLVFDRRHDEARRSLDALRRCRSNGVLPGPAFSALSELVRDDDDGLALFRAELAKFRAELPTWTPAERALVSPFLSALEGRSLFDRDRARGRRLLEQVLAQTAATGDDEQRFVGPRLLAFRRLVSDAVRHGDLTGALALMARENELALPEGCVLGISEDMRRAFLVARIDGKLLGSADRPASVISPELVVPPEMTRALAACVEVSVIASSPLRGRARLLPPELAWRHLASSRREAPRAWMPARHVVVSDVAPPPEMALPTLPPWQPPGSAAIARHLRGAEATPGAVLDELRRADLIEFHVHGVADFHRSDAPYLVLTGDTPGNARLTADVLRKTRLPARPFVVLAACDTARTSPFLPSYSGGLGLPAAFLAAGARAVLAADRPLPDRAATAFIADVLREVKAGASGARALRDVRMSWMKSDSGRWIDQIVVFE